MPGETAVYDLVSFGHHTLNRKHFGAVRSAAMISAAKAPHQAPHHQMYHHRPPPPKITVYNSAGSDETTDDEDHDVIYESLEQVQLRKSIESANRRAKTSKVRRTGHPLFDSLREERALKENVKRPAKEVVDPSNAAFDRHADYQNTIRKMKLYANPKLYKKNKKNSENLQHCMSLQQLHVPEKNKNYRRVSEHSTSQTLPKQLNVSKKALAKSEQNLMSLHPAYHRSSANMQHFQTMNPDFQHHMMHPVSAKRTAHGRIPNRHNQESSDSDSDWMMIPRPKVSSHAKATKNRHSDDSDTSGNGHNFF